MARGKVTRAETQSRRGVMKPSGVAWLGDIPEGWETLRNKWCFSCSKSIVGKASETAQLLSLTTSGVKCKGKEVLGGKLPESFDTYQEVSQNDLILCLFDMDCSAVFSGLSRFDGMISPAYKVVKCKSCIEPKYADYWFKFVGSQRFFKHYAKNIRYSLTFDEFAELMMIVPPLPEQRAIADYLDEKCGVIDAAIAEAKKGIEEYKAWKKSLIFEAVTGKRRVGIFNAEKQRSGEVEKMKPSGIPWIGEIPEGWSVSRVKEVATIKTGNTPDKQYQNEYYSTDSGVPWIKAENLGFMVPISQTAEYLTEEGVKQGRIFPPRTVFVCCIASIGKVGYSEKVASCNQQLNALVFNSRMYWKYGFYVTIAAEEEYLVRASGNVVKILNSSEQGLIAVPLPSIPEQQTIADYLDEKCAAIDAMVTEKESLIADLEAYKKSLIYETVTGKREVA